jgi:hypothetical protein
MTSSRLAVVLTLATLYAIPAAAQPRKSIFVFQNNFWLNLHQFVRGEAYRRSINATPGLDPATLNDADRATWTAAVDGYVDFSKRDVLFDDTLRQLQDILAGVHDVARLPAGLLDANTARTLNAAAPIYRARVWPGRQRDNDAWIARARALLERHETAMAARVAAVYRLSWPRDPVLVDAVGEIGPNSAITYSGIAGFSAHVQAGAASPRDTADAPLELLFHEVMHARELGSRVTSMIQEECARQTLETPPDLWHYTIMFTAGALAQRELANGYKTYGERYPGMPPNVRAAFQRDWEPYLDGKVSFDQALHDLVRDAR